MYEHRDIARQTAGLIASNLEGWEVDTTTEGVDQFLDGPDDARIRMFLDPSRLLFTGIFPETDIAVDHRSISCKRHLPPDVVATSIRKRLLNRYLPELARVQEHNRRASK